MWIARDKDNSLYAYSNPPIKEEESWTSANVGEDYYMIDENLYPEIKWEDENPTKVKLIIK